MYNIAWKTLTKESLKFIMDPINDPYKDFPFLELKETNIFPKKYFMMGGKNHARGIEKTSDEKSVALGQLLKRGWLNTSWPIPALMIDDKSNKLEPFDRRHTLKICYSIGEATHLPGAIYTRIHDVYGAGWLNELSDQSITIMASIWGNIQSAQPADTKDHHFEQAAFRIFEIEGITNPTREEVENILEIMGINDRYHTPHIKGICTKILGMFNEPSDLAGKLSHCTDKEDLKLWLRESNCFDENSNTDDLVSQFKTIDAGQQNCETYAYRIIMTAIDQYYKGRKYKVICASNNPQVKKLIKID